MPLKSVYLTLSPHLVAPGDVNTPPSPVGPSYTYIWPSRQPWRKQKNMQGHMMTVAGLFHHKKNLNFSFYYCICIKKNILLFYNKTFL